jgi:3-oxoacyl-[acyl-carrier protein] reductase
MGKKVTSKNKNVIVTGASRGIGREIALSYGRLRYNVCVNYAGNKEASESVVKEIEELGGNAFAYCCDVSDEEQVVDMLKKVDDTFGPVDVLVNNAGITKDALLIRMNLDSWQRVVDINLKGTFLCTKYAAKYMIKKKYGHIVNISSVVAFMGNVGQANYIASKSGIIGLTIASATELAKFGIRVNAIVPGFIWTNMTEKLVDQIKKDLTDKIALGYIGKPEDVSPIVVFLTSGAADYVTGQAIHVNGGLFFN